MNRRTLLKASLLFALPRIAATQSRQRALYEGKVMTVLGSVEPDALGFTLPHEHVLVDFERQPDARLRYHDLDEAYRVILPHLQQVKSLGCRTLVECTPAYLGRDPELLARLSRTTGLHLITNTGYYGARNDQNLPEHTFTDSAEQLAARWTKEFQDGIGSTGIRPGFIKIGVDAGPLSEIDRKLVQAAALTHRATGLVIASHTGPRAGAMEQIEILRAHGVRPSAWIWVHAQSEPDAVAHLIAARTGAWISFDGLDEQNLEQYIAMLLTMRKAGQLSRVLLSHDAGWYHVGEPNGGTYRGHDVLITRLLPALRSSGFSEPEIDMITVSNPARAFTIGKRTNT